MSVPPAAAQAEWNPSTQKLVCPFCGTESPYKIDRDQGKVVELDLVKALRELPEEERGWQTERRSVQCQSCRAVMVFDPARVGQNCEFCGSPALVDYQEIRSPIRPQGVLPFRVDASRVRDDVRRWWRSRWFAPGKLALSSLVDTIKSLYIPYWTFDAQVHCPWTAEAGYYYYVDVPGVDNKGRPVVRRERRVRWEPAAGVVDTFFDDEAVAGTQGLPIDLLRKVEPFPTKEVVQYDTAFLSGHVVEHYQVVLLDAAQRSVEQMQAKLMTLCAQQIPGDTHREPADLPGVLRPHVQACPRAGVVAEVRLRVEAVSGDRERLHRGDRRPASTQLLEDRAARAAGGAGHARLHLARFSIARRDANSQLPIPNSQYAIGRWYWGLGVDTVSP